MREDIQELNVLKEIYALIAQEHQDVRTFLRKILLTVNTLIGFDIAFIGLVEEGEARLLVLQEKAESFVGPEANRWSSYAKRLKIGGENLPFPERSFTGYVGFTKKSHRLGNVLSAPFYKQAYDEIRSELAVPILLEGELLGVINLESKISDFYTESHEEWLEMVAKAIARTLDYLLIREGSRRPSIEVTEKIKNVFNSVPPSIAFEATNAMNDVAKLIADAFNSTSCTIWVMDKTGAVLVLRGAYGPDRLGVHNEVEGHDSVAWRVMEQRTILKFGKSVEAADNEEFTTQHVHQYGGPFIVAPLLVGGDPIGVIRVEGKQGEPLASENEYTSRDERLLSILQSQIAAAIKEKRVEMERRQQVHDRLGPISQLGSLFAQLDLRTVLDKAVLAIPRLCGGRFCSIFLWEPDRNAFVLAASKGLEHLIGEASYEPLEGLTGWVGGTCRSLILNNRAEFLKKFDEKLEWRAKYDEAKKKNPSALHPFLAVPILSPNGGAEGVIRISDRDRGFFTEADEQLLFVVASHLSMVITYCRKFARPVKRLQIVDALMNPVREHLGARDKWRDDSLNALLVRGASGKAKDLLQAESVIFYQYNVETARFDMRPICEGAIKRPESLWKLANTNAVLQKVRDDGAQYWLDVQQQFCPKEDSNVPNLWTPELCEYMREEEIVSLAANPVTVGENFLGILFLTFRSPQVFADQKREDLIAFVEQFALALEIANLSRKAHLSASHEEANYLGQEIHDAVLQVIGAVIIHGAGSALDQLRKGNDKRAIEYLQRIEKAGKYCMEELYAIMGILRDHIVDRLGLKSAIENFILDCKPDTMTVHQTLCDIKKIPLHLQRHLYRILQEGFMNAVKHAGAPEVTVALTTTEDSVALLIEDNGVGFMPENESYKKGKYGLTGTNRRVNGLKGVLTIDSAPGNGTKFKAKIPLILTESYSLKSI